MVQYCLTAAQQCIYPFQYYSQMPLEYVWQVLRIQPDTEMVWDVIFPVAFLELLPFASQPHLAYAWPLKISIRMAHVRLNWTVCERVVWLFSSAVGGSGTVTQLSHFVNTLVSRDNVKARAMNLYEHHNIMGQGKTTTLATVLFHMISNPTGWIVFCNRGDSLFWYKTVLVYWDGVTAVAWPQR